MLANYAKIKKYCNKKIKVFYQKIKIKKVIKINKKKQTSREIAKLFNIYVDILVIK